MQETLEILENWFSWQTVMYLTQIDMKTPDGNLVYIDIVVLHHTDL